MNCISGCCGRALTPSPGVELVQRNSIRRFLPLFALILYLAKVKDAGVSHILISRSCRTVKLNVAIFTIQLELSRTLLVSLWT